MFERNTGIEKVLDEEGKPTGETVIVPPVDTIDLRLTPESASDWIPEFRMPKTQTGLFGIIMNCINWENLSDQSVSCGCPWSGQVGIFILPCADVLPSAEWRPNCMSPNSLSDMMLCWM